MIWKTESIEFAFKSVIITGIGLLFIDWLAWPYIDRDWKFLMLSACNVVILLALMSRLYKRTMLTFMRASAQLEALRGGDYSSEPRQIYNKGIVEEFNCELSKLGEMLLAQNQHRHHELRVLYRLIDQLNTPILVFNHRLLLTYANNAFQDLFGKPWQIMRHASPTMLGLEINPQWMFRDPEKAAQWLIRHSMFFDNGQGHQLLVFTDIQAAQRHSQLDAWEKLIRVISHEIRNSLTPVSALATNLQSRVTNERDAQALRVISERCKHLQEFVGRYSEIHKPLQINERWILAATLFDALQALFPQAKLRPEGLLLQLWSDPVLLQQVLINLVKNAFEAGKEIEPVDIVFSQNSAFIEIKVIDHGQGIANPHNLFVPFYSTKKHGQGIGLTLSRHIIERLGGNLSLNNNQQGGGACATIKLPLKKPLLPQTSDVFEHVAD